MEDEVKKSVEKLLDQGYDQFNHDRFEEALQAAEDAVRLDPDSVESWHLKGSALYRLNRNQEALQALEAAIRCAPSDAALMLGKGHVLFSLKCYSEALQSYETAILCDPRNTASWIGKGETLIKQNLYSEALVAFEKAILLDLKNSDAWEGKGYALYKQQSYFEALHAFEMTINLNPQSTNAWIGKGNVLDELKRQSEAIQAYDEAIKLDPTNEITWENKGHVLSEVNRYSEALETYVKAIRLNPKNAFSWAGKSYVLSELEHYSGALQAIEEAIRLDPADAHQLFFKGNVLTKMERTIEAIQAYESSIQAYDEKIRFDPDDALSWYNKGIVLTELNRYSEALYAFNEAIRLEPQNSHFISEKYKVLLQARRHERISGKVHAFFDYLEERPLTGTTSVRQRDVVAVDDPFGTPNRLSDDYSSLFAWCFGYTLEGRESAPQSEGLWRLTTQRILRHTGDPGKEKWPYKDRSHPIPINFESPKPCVRCHHYTRLLSSTDCIRVIQASGGCDLGLEVTEDWHNPSHGIISSVPINSPVLSSHGIPLFIFEPQSSMFAFPNSWGEEWGYHGWGMVSSEIIDRYLVECWTPIGIAKYPPLHAKSGLVILLWKSSEGGQEVHGREIIDAESGERIGWCFLVRRRDVLDVEELFVWPTHRKHGYGRILANLAHELSSQMRIDLRLLVSYADAELSNRSALKKITEILGLHLHPSTIKSVAFCGKHEPYIGVLSEPSMPERPASIHERLNPAKGTREYTVWFGTNRKPNDPEDLSKGFSGYRDTRVHYGSCNVAIPQSHLFGSVGSSWWRRWLRLSDDRLHVISKKGLSSDDFWHELSAMLCKYDASERQGLVFLHGYNIDFDEAAIRAAQIGFDLKIPGVTAFFSWPSRGKTEDYCVDEASIEASYPLITQFLRDFVKSSGVERVHLIAHSMGNRGLSRALENLAKELPNEIGATFGQIILAAPDIDVAVFNAVADFFACCSQRTTLYVSPADRAITASRWLHGYDRVGLTPPVTTAPKIDTVEVPQFNIFDFLGHGYYAEAEAVLNDMYTLIRGNTPPNERLRLSQVKTDKGKTYWMMCH